MYPERPVSSKALFMITSLWSHRLVDIKGSSVIRRRLFDTPFPPFAARESPPHLRTVTEMPLEAPQMSAMHNLPQDSPARLYAPFLCVLEASLPFLRHQSYEPIITEPPPGRTEMPLRGSGMILMAWWTARMRRTGPQGVLCGHRDIPPLPPLFTPPFPPSHGCPGPPAAEHAQKPP